jgi:hypothetical protein
MRAWVIEPAAALTQTRASATELAAASMRMRALAIAIGATLVTGIATATVQRHEPEGMQTGE